VKQKANGKKQLVKSKQQKERSKLPPCFFLFAFFFRYEQIVA